MNRTAIVGAGQVGTMLGMALRATRGGGVTARDKAWDGAITLFDVDTTVAQASLARGAGDRIAASLEEILNAGTILLALPVPAILRFLDEHGPRLGPGTFLMDTGSAKEKVVETMRTKVPVGVQAIGGHPLAGTEQAGPWGARPELLRGAPFVLTPVREDQRALSAACALALAVGATPLVLEAGEHDRILALTSHLPHLIALALVRCVDRIQASAPVAGKLTTSGFHSVTRLADSDADMVAGFLWANRREVRGAARAFRGALDELLDALGRRPEGQARPSAGNQDRAV